MQILFSYKKTIILFAALTFLIAITHQTDSNQSPPKLSTKLIRIGYYPAYASKKYPFEDIYFPAFTHLNLAFADITYSGALKIPRSFQIEKWQPIAAKHNIKLLISVGGWGQGYNFPHVANHPQKRRNFARSIVSYLRDNNLNGIDLDWEYPKNPTDKNNFSLLLNEIRSEMDNSPGQKLELSVALAASPYFLKFYDLKEIYKYCDYVGLMTYDFHGPWNKY